MLQDMHIAVVAILGCLATTCFSLWMYDLFKAIAADIAISKWMLLHPDLNPRDWPEGRQLLEDAIVKVAVVEQRYRHQKATEVLQRLYILRGDAQT